MNRVTLQTALQAAKSRRAWCALGAVCFLAGCTAVPRNPAALETQPLPDAVSHQTLFTTADKEVTLQVANLLNEGASKRHLLGDLRDEGVIGVLLRVENHAPTRLLISEAQCRLYGKRDGSLVEIPPVRWDIAARRFTEGKGGVYGFGIPLHIISVFGIFSLGTQFRELERIDRKNSILYELFMGVAWNRRAIGPGGIEKGLLFFDWDLAEEYRDELYLAIDMRDLVNDWHLVAPVKLNVVYEDHWFSTTYH